MSGDHAMEGVQLALRVATRLRVQDRSQDQEIFQDLLECPMAVVMQALVFATSMLNNAYTDDQMQVFGMAAATMEAEHDGR